MLKFRQTQVKEKAVHLWSIATIFAVYWALPTLIHIMAECSSTGSGSGCAG